MSAPIKSKLFAIILVLGLGAAVAFGGQVDARFDGQWVGVELFRYQDGISTLIGVPQVTATLGIADSGQLFGILAGLERGRYIISDKSHENTIVINSSRRTGTFTLSRGGSTLKEYGRVVVNTNMGPRGCQVWATFHRVSKQAK